jgi:hypothetical protein
VTAARRNARRNHGVGVAAAENDAAAEAASGGSSSAMASTSRAETTDDGAAVTSGWPVFIERGTSRENGMRVRKPDGNSASTSPASSPTPRSSLFRTTETPSDGIRSRSRVCRNSRRLRMEDRSSAASTNR